MIALKSGFVALATIASIGISAADEVKLISIGGVKLALDPIVADFTKTTGHTVKYTVGSPAAVSQKLAAGEALDVAVLSVPAMDDLAKLNALRPEIACACWTRLLIFPTPMRSRKR